MKFINILSTAVIAMAGQVYGFYGQMAASDYILNEGGVSQTIYLTDYNTGSTYQGTLYGGFNACTTSECSI